MEIKIPKIKKIDGGEFWMGSRTSNYSSETPYHKLFVDSFYIGIFPVTIEEFKYFKMMNNSNFSKKIEIIQSNNEPATEVTWTDAIDYCHWLSNQTSENYRLLTEAEWEYAAKAGKDLFHPTSTGKISSILANYGNNVGSISPVGSYPPNPFGLYDMAGNVWE